MQKKLTMTAVKLKKSQCSITSLALYSSTVKQSNQQIRIDRFSGIEGTDIKQLQNNTIFVH